MIMKKFTAALLILALMTVLLTACGNKSYKDGVFTGKSQEDDLGAYGEVTLVIKDNQITQCEYVTWQSDGSVKGEDYGKVNGEISNADYYEKAQLAVRAMEQYAQQLPVVQQPDKIDAVSGATNSYNQFLEAVDAALTNAKR